MKLLVMKCNNRRHRAIIKHFREVAEKQQEKSIKQDPSSAEKKPADFVLQPWENKCTDDFVFIAYEGTKQHIILGWMQVSLKDFEYTHSRAESPLHIAHVDYISTNQNRAGEGIGKI